MPLVMFDLDNTVIDRDEMFRKAVGEFLARHDLPLADLDWVLALDDSGYTPRDTAASAMLRRYGEAGPCVADSVDALLRDGGSQHAVVDAGTAQALSDVRAAGCQAIIVTNGTSAQQTDKIITAGLDVLVDGWVISEQVGVKKPDPAIFQAAAQLAGTDLAGAWVVGDSDDSDILGAHRLGLDSVWLHHGRTWQRKEFCPTRQESTVADAVRTILSLR